MLQMHILMLLFVMGASPSFAATELGPCDIQLFGGEHLEQRDLVHDLLKTHVRGSGSPVRVDFLDVFDPDVLFQTLQANGVGESSVRDLKSYLEEARQKTKAGKPAIIEDSFVLLNTYHEAAKTLVNLCVVGKGCVGFDVNGEERPYLSMGILSPTILGSVQKIDAGESVGVVDSFSLNTVVLRGDERPDYLIANLFSGLGSAQIIYFLRGWAQKMNQDGRVSPLAKAMTRRIREGEVVLDLGFLHFMQNMQAHRAEVAVRDIFANRFHPSVFTRPGNLFEIKNVIARILQYPMGKEFLDRYRISPYNAETFFDDFDRQLTKDVLAI